MHTVSVANSKGGTGKTTLAAHLAAGLARRGQRVLLIDSDGQAGNVGTALALDRTGALVEWLVRRRPLNECVVTVPGYDLLDVVTTDQTMIQLTTRPLTDILQAALGEADGYQYCVIDTQPSFSALQTSALAVSDFLLIATLPEYTSLIGINHMTGLMRSLQQQGADLQLLGIVPMVVYDWLRETKRSMAELQRTFGNLVYPTVRRTVRVREAARLGVLVWDHAARHPVVDDFERVVKRFIKDTKGGA